VNQATCGRGAARSRSIGGTTDFLPDVEVVINLPHLREDSQVRGIAWAYVISLVCGVGLDPVINPPPFVHSHEIHHAAKIFNLSEQCSKNQTDCFTPLRIA
jgi:hypothetical protein